jgi:hypothetical protein
MPGAVDLAVPREGFGDGIIALYARDEEEIQALKTFSADAAWRRTTRQCSPLHNGQPLLPQ